MIFQIEDMMHAEWHKKFNSKKEAWEEIEYLSKIPWNNTPNKAPCEGWEECQRIWAIITYDDSNIPWKEKESVEVVQISSKGVEWLKEKKDFLNSP